MIYLQVMAIFSDDFQDVFHRFQHRLGTMATEKTNVLSIGCENS